MVFTVLTCIFVATAVIQLAYLISFIPILFHKTTNATLEETLPISVIVCAKNEVSNLNKLKSVNGREVIKCKINVLTDYFFKI